MVNRAFRNCRCDPKTRAVTAPSAADEPDFKWRYYNEGRGAGDRDSLSDRGAQSILQAEAIDQAANTLTASVKGSHDQGLAHDIQDRVVQSPAIFRTSPVSASPM
jgi:hypothetical protein